MYLLHRLPGQRADPTGSPAENTGTEQRAEKSGNGIGKTSAHHPNAGEDEPAKADDCARVHSEGFESGHERLGSGEVHRSLRMRETGEGQSE